MPNDTTIDNAPTTLSKSELWALFVGHTMRITLSMGPTVEAYKPEDMLRDPGEWGDMQDFSNALTDSLANDEDPGAALLQWIGMVESYLGNLKQVHRDFVSLGDSLLAETDDDEERYHRPVIASGRAA